MNSFVQRHASSVIGVLNGFDRLRIRGTLRCLSYTDGLGKYLSKLGVPLREFKGFMQTVTREVREATQRLAASLGRPLKFLSSSSVSKEATARQIAEQDRIHEGLVCVLGCVEPCWSYDLGWDASRRHLELRRAQRKCMHYYHYRFHPQVGFMHARFQTWFPFSVNIWINGREWLARQMDRAQLGYLRRENCFVQVADVNRAQALLDEQLCVDWKELLDNLVPQFNPDHVTRFPESPGYYWSVDESEWATDVMFRTPEALAALYPRLIRHGISTLGSRDVMRFLGRKVPAHGGINGRFQGEVLSDLRTRPEGMRLKHRLNRNSIKMYDKQGSVLRVETTLLEAEDIKVCRPAADHPGGPWSWRPMRKAVADIYRRGRVCQAANDRYLEALASVENTTVLRELTEPLCRPVVWKGKRARGLNPLSPDDAALLEAVSQGEFAIHGFRNRDLRARLYGDTATDPKELRRRSAVITRKLRLLRAHGLIRKVTRTHRYLLTDAGRTAIAALLAARAADTAKLANAA
jgi:hypothetical protein